MNEPYAKKSLGQHWLHDDASLATIAEAVQVGPEDTVLEIGPGTGTLTRVLAARAKQVVAVEFDPELYELLSHQQFAKNLQIVHADILKFDLTALPAGYKVVANIPYYLTSNLLRVLSESSNPPAAMALLMQREVAERVCARPGDMSLLSVSVQLYYETGLGKVIPAELFTPPPKVDSQVLILHRCTQPLFPIKDTRQFFRVVKAGFSNKRKTLLNSLSAGLNRDKTEVKALLETAGIDPGARAQTLALDDWYRLYEAIDHHEITATSLPD